MQDFDRLNRIAKRLQERYPRGTRIVLLSMGNDPNPILPGTRGTVNVVDDIATVHCTFDNGRTLGIAYGEDSFRALTAEELAEESEGLCSIGRTKTKSGRAETDKSKLNRKRVIELPEKVPAKCFKTV